MAATDADAGSAANQRSHVAARVAAVVVVAATVLALRAMGRVWWCEAGDPWPASPDADGRHNSQHVFDPYSLTHLLHGVLLFGLLWPARRRLSWAWRLVVTLVVEAGWEVVENTPAVIGRYRAATAAVGYAGDAVANSLGDLACCAAGFWLAGRLGLWRSALLFVAVELGLLVAIRDNLTLSALMLTFPVDAIRAWQAGG